MFDIGDKIRITGTFTLADTNTDPTAVTLKVKDPSGSIDTYTYAGSSVTRSAAGVYYKDISLDEAGDWYYRWIGTGTVETAEEERFAVRKSRIT